MSADYPPQTHEEIADFNRWNIDNYRFIALYPLSWRSTAHEQLWSAQILYNAYRESESTPVSDDRERNAARFPGLKTLGSCHLLFGLAVENLCKALAVQREIITLKEGDRLVIPPPFGAHRLNEMAKALGINTSPDEEETLRMAGLALNSVARYPVAHSASTHTLKRQCDGSIATPVTLSVKYIERTKAFANKLDEIIDPSPLIQVGLARGRLLMASNVVVN